jgi:ethanolamine ammonia-lyase small subunit
MTDRPDPLLALRRFTPARIGLGRVGHGLPLRAHLAFQAAHARARDAVRATLDADALAAAVAAGGWPVLGVRSAAADKPTYLRRPDLGRVLAAASKAALSEPMVAPDVVIVLGDGLSSAAIARHAVPVLEALWPRLQGLRLAPVIVATGARVALADQIGELMQARVAVMMIGERPGLSVTRSLGLYLTYAPRVGRLDSERNCISNVHEDGLSAATAALQASELIRSMLAQHASGVALSPQRAVALSAG